MRAWTDMRQRKAIIADLEAEGALLKTEEHSHNVGTCYRCGTTVEPRVSKQWFVAMQQLAKPAIEAVKSGETKFVPPHFEKTYFHWLENIRGLVHITPVVVGPPDTCILL